MTIEAEIDQFLRQWPDAEFGPGHIALADFNLEDEFIQFCLKELAKWERFGTPSGALLHTAEELVATRAFLEHLLTIPEAERVIEEDEGESWHRPLFDDFPPFSAR